MVQARGADPDSAKTVRIRWAAVAGMVAAAGFPLVIAGLDLVQRDFLIQTDPRLDPLVSNPVSAHELGPYGLAQHLNFLLTGLLIGVFGAGLYRALPPSRWAKASRVALIVLGFGIALGVFTLDVSSSQTFHGRIHAVGFLILVFASMVVPFVLAAALLRNPRARWLAWVALGVGIATVVVVFVPNAKGSYSNWFGPASKLHLLITFGFLEAIAIWLWVLAARGETSRKDLLRHP